MTKNTNTLLALGPGGFHRIAYTEWGDPGNPRKLVCAHGLTRQGRDFDALAEALADAYHVACPDMVGRGRSDWLADKAGYDIPQYCADMTTLIARLGADQVDWVGTSMGGLIGMTMAAQAKTPIRRLVLNDVGPFIPRAALERIGRYVGREPVFANLDEAVAYMCQVHATFGPLTPENWRRLAVHSVKPVPGGGYGLRYDPAISAPFRKRELTDVDMWAVWDAVRCPVLVLRGAESDLLSAATAREMAGRGPGAEIREFPGIGHAPALMDPEQIAPVREWLLRDD